MGHCCTLINTQKDALWLPFVPQPILCYNFLSQEITAHQLEGLSMLAHSFLLAVDNFAASHRELQYVAEVLCNR